MPSRRETIDQLLKQLKVVVDQLHPVLNFERLDYNMIVTEHSQLREQNEKLKAQNAEVEASIAKSVQTSRDIVNQGNEEMKRLKVAAGELYAKAFERYQQVEAYLGEAEKRSVTQHLKKIEASAV